MISKNIPKSDYNRFWQISGRCINSSSGLMIGKRFPENINELEGVTQRKRISAFGGEKSNCRKVEILRSNLFPEYDDTKFVTENTVWEKINRYYDTYCVNDIFRVYYDNSSDSLAKGKIHNDTRMRSRYRYSIFCLNSLFDEVLYNKNVCFAICNIARASICTGIPYSIVMKDLNRKYKRFIVTIIGWPLGFLYAFVKDNYHFRK